MYGLVLEGGGAKGAYQIGACKAMRELGISYGAVAGTSIGALNGAMIVQDELDKAYELWYEMSPSKVFDIEEVRLEELKKLDISHDGLLYYMKKTKKLPPAKVWISHLSKNCFRKSWMKTSLENPKCCLDLRRSPCRI